MRLTLPFACVAFALSGCGPGAPRHPAPPPAGVPRISLVLKQSGGDVQLLACSLVHHYATFSAGKPIAFEGALAPKPNKNHFKVKVKFKRCVDGRFQDSGSIPVKGADGRYTGQLNLPGKGVFFARSRYRNIYGDAFSDKIYFRVK